MRETESKDANPGCARYGTQIAGCVENEEDEKGEMQANIGGGDPEGGCLRSNLRPARMRRSRPVRYFPARGWRANRSRSPPRDDGDHDNDDDND